MAYKRKRYVLFTKKNRLGRFLRRHLAFHVRVYHQMRNMPQEIKTM